MIAPAVPERPEEFRSSRRRESAVSFDDVVRQVECTSARRLSRPYGESIFRLPVLGCREIVQANQRLGDQPSPAGLMACATATARVAMEVLMEWD